MYVRILVNLVFAVPSIAFATSVQAAPAACGTAEHRQFDFWLGDWRVQQSDGKLAGTNRVTLEYDKCVVHEHYVTGRGYSGESLNVYDASRHVWHQTWVDTDGLLLTLEGGLKGKSMVLEGQTATTDGHIAKQRITWTPNADGSVRQLWESTDAKGAWTIAFDGKYTKQ
jgi:hypothetical protein